MEMLMMAALFLACVGAMIAVMFIAFVSGIAAGERVGGVPHVVSKRQ
jgi:hypothetical protein